MPFTEFCCRSGGSNLNAGTLTGNSTEPGTSASFTYASGSWVASTGVFTVASGNPQSDGVAVGDFASVYADGSTVTGFVGRVTARTTTTITVSLSAKSGTAPTDGTSNRTLKIGGAWQGPNGSSGFPFNFVTNTLTNASSHLPRVNCKNDATYSITANISTVNTQVTLQGYSSSYGDLGRAVLDGGTSGASYNLLGSSIGALCNLFDFECRNNGATGSATGVFWNNSGVIARCVFHDFRGNGCQSNGSGLIVSECEAYACNQSNTTDLGGFSFLGSGNYWVRCISHDNTGSNAIGFHTNASVIALDCVSDTNGGRGFNFNNSTGNVFLRGCDAYNNTSDGLRLGSAGAYIENCNFIKNGGWGINGNTVKTGLTYNNGFGAGTQANTSGTTTAMNGIIEVGSVTYANDVTPWVDPANGDFRINLATAKGAGRGTFTQTAASYSGTVGYPDIGAAQHQDTGSSGGLNSVRHMTGGFSA